MSAATENLKASQRQLDADGCHVGVSRQALEECLEQHSELLETLQWLLREAENYMDAEHNQTVFAAAHAAIKRAEDVAYEEHQC